MQCCAPSSSRHGNGVQRIGEQSPPPRRAWNNGPQRRTARTGIPRPSARSRVTPAGCRRVFAQCPRQANTLLPIRSLSDRKFVRVTIIALQSFGEVWSYVLYNDGSTPRGRVGAGANNLFDAPGARIRTRLGGLNKLWRKDVEDDSRGTGSDLYHSGVRRR